MDDDAKKVPDSAHRTSLTANEVLFAEYVAASCNQRKRAARSLADGLREAGYPQWVLTSVARAPFWPPCDDDRLAAICTYVASLSVQSAPDISLVDGMRGVGITDDDFGLLRAIARYQALTVWTHANVAYE